MDLGFDEAANAGPEHLGRAAARGYDVRARFDPSAEVALLRQLGLDGSRTLIDFGAATGTFALAAAPHCGRVVAVDVSPAMVEVLREKAAAAGVANVVAVEAGFLTYEHAGEPADFAFSRHALHHLPDFWKFRALVSVAAALRPGGILRLVDLVYAFEPADRDDVLRAWIESAPVAGPGWIRSDLERHVREEHSTYTWLLEPMLERAGFTIRERTYGESGIFAAYVCDRRADR